MFGTIKKEEEYINLNLKCTNFRNYAYIIFKELIKEFKMNKFLPSRLTATQQNDEPIDPGFTYPDSDTIIPPADDIIDPGFTYPDSGTIIPPSNDAIDPGFSVVPPVYPIYSNIPPFVISPGTPCIFCNNNQWIRGGIRLLNAVSNYGALSIYIDNRLAYSGLNFSEITQYRQISQGNHIFTVIGMNGYVYIRKSLFVGDGMATVAIINSANGLDLTSIADTACPINNNSACFRISNLAYYTGAVNASISNVFFNSINFKQTASFSQFDPGNYTVNVSQSIRPEIVLVTASVVLNPRRIYTLYVLNWNPSADKVQTLLVEDRRG